MIDREQELFDELAPLLREEFDAYVTGSEYTAVPPKFPAISFRQTNNSIDRSAMTFHSVENLVDESYIVEVYTNKTTGAKAEVKKITAFISDFMTAKSYIRTFCNMVENMDRTYTRMISRYEIQHTKGE